MAETISDILVERLIEWGVERVFGMPGDGINGIMEALRKRSDDIAFIQVRHEESAAFMAVGHAKYTGRLGCCLATTGPGGLHLLNGLYDAKLDGAPVLAITGLQFHDLVGTHGQQDVELDRVFADVCVYNTRIMGGHHVEVAVDLACRKALSARGVSHVTIPTDVQETAVKQPRSERNVPDHSRPSVSPRSGPPNVDDVKDAVSLLESGDRIAILAGQGAAGTGPALEQLAERLGAPIIKALLGKDIVVDESPFTTGGIGLLGTSASERVLEACDRLLIVGSSFPYMEYYPVPGQARAVQIDNDPARIGLRYPVDVGIVGDASQCISALVDACVSKSDRSFLSNAQSWMKEWRDHLEAQLVADADPMKPQWLAHVLGRHLDSDAILSVDSGTVTAWWARYIPVRGNQRHSVSGTLASMANAVPYAIAAKLAHPSRQSVAFIGDGGMSMLMAELATAAKYDLAIKVIVLKNNSLANIKWEQIGLLGNPPYGTELQPIDFAAVAEACGVRGFRVSASEEAENVIQEALGTTGPALVEASVDPEEPPLPARPGLGDAATTLRGLLRGTPGAGRIVRNLVQGQVRQIT